MNATGASGRLALAVAAILLGATPHSERPLGGEPKVYSFHIVSQSLVGGLQEFARQSGMQIIFFSHLTDGKRAAEVNGSYTVQAAMTALLAPSALTFRIINPRTLEIRPPRTTPTQKKQG